MSMKKLSIDTILDNINPATYNINILHWCELTAQSNYDNIVLFGNEIDNKLFSQRLAKYSIPIFQQIDYSLSENNDSFEHYIDLSKYIVIVTFRDFPGNQFVYDSVMEELKKYNVYKPYIIHDFSAGFALGAELINEEKREIKEAYQHLADEESKHLFLTTLKKATQPYGWNMDFNNENFGVPDKKIENIDNIVDDISELKCDNLKTVLYCTTQDINNNSTALKMLTNCAGLIMFIPNNITRRRFREYLLHQNNTTHFPILNNILWSETKIFNYKHEMYTGGTPLRYKKVSEKISAITTDEFVETNNISNISCIVADMNSDFLYLLNGASRTIYKQQPDIIIIGFHEINSLWRAINCLHKKYGENYSIYLNREPRENVLEGHILNLKRKEV